MFRIKFVEEFTGRAEVTSPMLQQIEKFQIILIKPSKYDDDGYLIRFWKGVLPSKSYGRSSSNSIAACAPRPRANWRQRWRMN